MYCPCKSYFTFITKEKLYFSLICSFYCCLVKGVWVLKVVWQFTTQGVVAYKFLIKKCIQPITLWGIFWCFWIIARNIKCGLIIHGEDSISRLFYKTILKVSLFFFWFGSSCCAIIMTDAVAQRTSVQTVFLRISQNSQEKHLCLSFFFNKVASLGSSASLRTRIWLRYFSVNFCRTFPLAAFVMISNARVYNLSSGPYITDFSPVVAKKRNIFE